MEGAVKTFILVYEEQQRKMVMEEIVPFLNQAYPASNYELKGLNLTNVEERTFLETDAFLKQLLRSADKFIVFFSPSLTSYMRYGQVRKFVNMGLDANRLVGVMLETCDLNVEAKVSLVADFRDGISTIEKQKLIISLNGENALRHLKPRHEDAELSGKTVDRRYEIMDLLGRGGTGSVYLCTDLRLKRFSAIKVLNSKMLPYLHLFQREAEILSHLDHPALPKVYDFFEEEVAGEPKHFLVMEYISGEDFGDKIKREGALAYTLWKRYAFDLLDVVDFLHYPPRPIIHRDIKPQNLKLKSSGQLMLLDFGLARNPAFKRSDVSLIAYSEQYAPMEVISGASFDQRSDIFSIGATLYHMLTGVQPTDASTRANAIVVSQPDPLIRPSSYQEQMKEKIHPKRLRLLDAVLCKAMAMNPNERFRHVGEIQAALFR